MTWIALSSPQLQVESLRRHVGISSGLFVAIPLLQQPNPKPPLTNPNIVILLADDWGLTDVGAFGGEIATPNIDALAKQGTRFSNFHAMATCSPTRSVLMTGVDNHRNGVGNMPESMPAAHEGKPGYEGVLSDNVVTIATMLKVNG
ncbi:MAG: sulfatase-like hydrolase/transferase [Rhodocyclaceae bacterium]|nr:sulfatase-like hydrolase/transferase [Rhodocyclaceae bacterium]